MEPSRYEYPAKNIFEACLEVPKNMGPGLLENVYESCLIKEFELRNIKTKAQVPVPIFYKGFKIEKDYKIDLLIENEIILELKTCEVLLPVHTAQLISYLKLADKRMGFLVYFNVRLIKNGLKRFVNQYNNISEEDLD